MDRSRENGHEQSGSLENEAPAPVLQVFDPTCSHCGLLTFPGLHSVFQRRVAEYTAKLADGVPMTLPVKSAFTLRRWMDGGGVSHVLAASPELREVPMYQNWPVIDLGDGQ